MARVIRVFESILFQVKDLSVRFVTEVPIIPRDLVLPCDKRWKLVLEV